MALPITIIIAITIAIATTTITISFTPPFLLIFKLRPVGAISRPHRNTPQTIARPIPLHHRRLPRKLLPVTRLPYPPHTHPQILLLLPHLYQTKCT